MNLHDTIEKIVQDMAYKINDLCESYPGEAIVFFLIAEQLHIRALLPFLSEQDRLIFDKLPASAVVTTLPKAFDPRKKRD